MVICITVSLLSIHCCASSRWLVVPCRCTCEHAHRWPSNPPEAALHQVWPPCSHCPWDPEFQNNEMHAAVICKPRLAKSGSWPAIGYGRQLTTHLLQRSRVGTGCLYISENDSWEGWGLSIQQAAQSCSLSDSETSCIQ